MHPTSGVTHRFNINEPLGDLMVKALRATGQLSASARYDLDYDNQVIPTEKWDAAKTYKKCYGYQPAVASINSMPVYIEGRNGNSHATFEQASTLRRMFARLKANNVRIGCFRADSGSYLEEAVQVVEAGADRFYIRARRSAEMNRQIGQVPAGEWSSIKLGWQKMDVTEISWTPFGGVASYRLIVSRIKRSDHQGELFSGGAYRWRAIMTNDQACPKQIVGFYNKRRASERLFDVTGNDVGGPNCPARSCRRIPPL